MAVSELRWVRGCTVVGCASGDRDPGRGRRLSRNARADLHGAVEPRGAHVHLHGGAGRADVGLPGRLRGAPRRRAGVSADRGLVPRRLGLPVGAAGRHGADGACGGHVRGGGPAGGVRRPHRRSRWRARHAAVRGRRGRCRRRQSGHRRRRDPRLLRQPTRRQRGGRHRVVRRLRHPRRIRVVGSGRRRARVLLGRRRGGPWSATAPHWS